MVRYISLLLFIVLAWGQEFDPETDEIISAEHTVHTDPEIVILADQESGIDTGLNKAGLKDIFQSAYETAFQDWQIDKNEEAILNTLQNSLNLSNEEITVLKSLYEQKQNKELDQSGRWPLVLQNMAWGGGLYGWAIPYVMDAEDFKWYIGTEMMSLGGAFYLTYQYTKEMEISHSKAQMMRAGSLLGFRYGWGVNTLLDLWPDDEDSKTSTWILMASIPAGIYAGDYLYKKWDPSNGQAWALALSGEVGSYTVRQLHHVFDQVSDEPDWDDWDDKDYKKWREDQKKWNKRHTLFELSSYPLSVYLGHRYFGEKSYTFGDALMLFQGRLLGWLYGVMLSDISSMDFEENNSRIVRTATTIGGTLLLDRFIRDRDYTFGQSILSVLGTGSGIAFASGVAIIIEVDDFETVEMMMMAGGIAGLYLSDSILNVKSESSSSLSTSEKTFSIIPSFQVIPNSQGYQNKYTLIPSFNVTAYF